MQCLYSWPRECYFGGSTEHSQQFMIATYRGYVKSNFELENPALRVEEGYWIRPAGNLAQKAVVKAWFDVFCAGLSLN